VSPGSRSAMLWNVDSGGYVWVGYEGKVVGWAEQARLAPMWHVRGKGIVCMGFEVISGVGVGHCSSRWVLTWHMRGAGDSGKGLGGYRQ